MENLVQMWQHVLSKRCFGSIQSQLIQLALWNSEANTSSKNTRQAKRSHLSFQKGPSTSVSAALRFMMFHVESLQRGLALPP